MRLIRYGGVRGHQNLAAISAAVEVCGATIIEAPDPRVAPYEYVIRSAHGERLDLVCYAFTARRCEQRDRPTGKHRFQVKYGSVLEKAHALYFDPSRRRITLMFGVHHEHELFVAVDPRMHSPTSFSSSVGLNERALLAAKASGWHAWERERRETRQTRPEENLQTEALLAFRPEFFLRYAAFERLASGVDCGERVLMADRAAPTPPPRRTRHTGLPAARARGAT